MKSLAFKAKEEDESETSDEDKEITLLTKRFNKFMRKEKFLKRKPFENKKFSKDTPYELKCFECKKSGHIKVDYPQYKKLKMNKKKKLLAILNEKDSLSFDSSQQEEAVNFCLMAREENEVSLASKEGKKKWYLDSGCTIRLYHLQRWR